MVTDSKTDRMLHQDRTVSMLMHNKNADKSYVHRNAANESNRCMQYAVLYLCELLVCQPQSAVTATGHPTIQPSYFTYNMNKYC